MNPQNPPAIVVFARAPSTESKALGLNRHDACQWHAHLLQRTLNVARSTDAAVYLVSDSPNADLNQRGNGFEERFLNALKDVAALGHTDLIIIGSDTPGLSQKTLRKALFTPDCVGPASDGGFYLLRISAQNVETLHGLPWHHSGLLSALLERFPDAQALETLDDVDDWQDLVQARTEYHFDIPSPFPTKPFVLNTPLRSQFASVATDAPRGPPAIALF